MCVLWIWKKRRENSRSDKRIVTNFVRPHALKGDVLSAAHNPNCSGTLNAVSRLFAKWAEWNNVQQNSSIVRTRIICRTKSLSLGSEVFEDQIFIFILPKHTIVKLHMKLLANMHFQFQNSKFSYSFHPVWLKFLLWDSKPTPMKTAPKQCAPLKALVFWKCLFWQICNQLQLELRLSNTHIHIHIKGKQQLKIGFVLTSNWKSSVWEDA